MDITVEELKERMDANESLHIIDVREPHEYEEFNIGVQNIPMGEIPTRLDEIKHLKDEELIVHCRSGGRSGNIQSFLQSNGFTNVRNLIGGMLEWQEKFPA